MKEPTMEFGEVLKGLRAGRLFAREGWNGKGMFIYLVQGSQFVVNRLPLVAILGAGEVVTYDAHIDMKTAQGTCVPWLASQNDLLADDWAEAISP